MSLINYPANFNGVDLVASVTGLTILATNPYVPPKRNLTVSDLARMNKAKVNAAFYNKRSITLRCGLTRATRALVEQSFDTLLSLIQGREKDLLLNQSGGQRKYTATFSDCVLITEGGSYLEFNLVFDTSDHYGYDTADTLLLQTSGFTSSTKTDQIQIAGSAEWQVPKTTITFTAISGGTSKTVQVGNDATGQQVAVTRTWVAGDVLIIDALEQSVKVNGVEVAFSGALPEWVIGTGYVTYADNFTSSRTWSRTMTYKKRYV